MITDQLPKSKKPCDCGHCERHRRTDEVKAKLDDPSDQEFVDFLANALLETEHERDLAEHYAQEKRNRFVSGLLVGLVIGMMIMFACAGIAGILRVMWGF